MMRLPRPACALRAAAAALWLAALRASVPAEPVPWDWSATPDLAPGVKLARLHVEQPRACDLFCLAIDLANPRVGFAATPGDAACGDLHLETQRRTTRGFLRASREGGLDMVAAINADAFAPWPAPWNMETCTDLKGLAVADGRLVSPGSGTPSFVVFKDRTTTITLTTADTDISRIHTAVSGFATVLNEGTVIEGGGDFHPRTGIGLSRDCRKVFWLVIDGRRHASIGATTGEVGMFLKSFGAWTGLNLDGGGSSTLATWEGGQVRLINNPVGNGRNWLKGTAEAEARSYAPTERCNGNNIGIVLIPAGQL